MITGVRASPFKTTPNMPTFNVFTRKDSPMPAGIDVNDPCCPDCSQYPLVQHGTIGGHKVCWCNNCGVLVEITHEDGQPPNAVVLRPTARTNEHHGQLM